MCSLRAEQNKLICVCEGEQAGGTVCNPEPGLSRRLFSSFLSTREFEFTWKLCEIICVVKHLAYCYTTEPAGFLPHAVCISCRDGKIPMFTACVRNVHRHWIFLLYSHINVFVQQKKNPLRSRGRWKSRGGGDESRLFLDGLTGPSRRETQSI